ncbi:hypothetical protein [Nonomuraea sp. B19D2]|uniref:hypothetical protein n=1 Tax=Nonomuraea sp. B19D2 TaxID=3159561 RepID=UPI0032DB09E3
MSLLDVIFVNVTPPSVGRGTGAPHLAALQWVVDACQLTLADRRHARRPVRA